MGPPVFMEVAKFIDCLEAYFPLTLQEGWDNSGLQVSPKEDFIKAVLLALDVTLDTVSEASEKGCNLIVAHHPLIFSPVKCIDRNVYPYSTVYKAIEKGIGIYAFHTNLDIADRGLNDFVCRLLNLENVRKIEEISPVRIGELSQGMTFEEFCLFVKKKLDVDIIKYVKSHDRKIKRVALCTGSCMDLIEKLNDEEFDVFVSSDLKHHQAIYAKENGVNVIDATHFHTEKFAKKILKDIIEENCVEDIGIFVSEKDSLPWKYF